MKCPFIDRSFTPDPTFNKPITYSSPEHEDDYIFYRHDDGFGNKSNVQFCQLCGRKRDVFQCLNESEWKRCPHYQVHMDGSP